MIFIQLFVVSNHHYTLFCTKPFIENKLRDVYYGGQTELFKPQSENGFVFDVNSLYPFVLMNHIMVHLFTIIKQINVG